ncbi:MAG: fibronectin type III domain-containing protein, partial [Robiginitomaculum sp.]|nr:fibronectin type III domain-containing protein [Robiginitomaculum sp.]
MGYTIVDGGLPIKTYILELTDDPSGNFGTNPDYIEVDPTTSNTDPEIQYTIFGLTNGQDYTFRVKVVNEIGESVPSNDAFGTPATVPNKPTGLSTIPDDASITLSWNEPESNGSEIISYLVEYSTNGAFDESTPSSTVSTTSEIISGLINGQEYTLRVTATNEVGDSFSSATVTVTPAATSSSPYALILDVLSSTEIDLEWSPPKDTTGGDVTGYLIERHSGDGVFVEIATTIVDGTSSDTTYS